MMRIYVLQSPIISSISLDEQEKSHSTNKNLLGCSMYIGASVTIPYFILFYFFPSFSQHPYTHINMYS